MVTPIVTSDQLKRRAERARVFLRAKWLDDWVEEEHLRCVWMSWAAAPTVSSAELRWDYGRGMREGEIAVAQVNPLELLAGRRFVKIEIDPQLDEGEEEEENLAWHGVILEEGRNPDGAEIGEEARVPSGHQRFLAYGLEVLLDRQPLIYCWWEHASGQESRLGRFLPVNQQAHGRDGGGDPKLVRGNRSAEVGPRGVYIFAGDTATAETWSTRDLLRYLLEYYGPVDQFGEPAITFELDEDSLDQVPDFDEPQVDPHGRSLKQVLDMLLDRRRLLSYTVEVLPDGNGIGDDLVRVRCFNFLDEDLDLNDGQFFNQNPAQKSLDFDAARDIAGAHVRLSAGQRYDLVYVVGARIVCCGTIGYLDGTLVPHWSNLDQAVYNVAASWEPDYPGPAEISEREARNKQYRAREELARVFSWFGLPAAWDGEVGNGEGGAKNDLFPWDSLGWDKTDQSAWYAPDVRFQRHLPLKSDHNYGLTKIATDAVIDNTANGQHWEYLRPLVLIKIPDAHYKAYARYVSVETLAKCSEVELLGDGEGRKTAYHVRCQDEGPGLVLRACSGLQHAIASTDFVALAGGGDENPGSFNYKDNLLATVAIRADAHLEQSWPAAVAEPSEALRVLTIDAGRRCEIHWIAPGTVVGLEDGQLVRTSGGFLRDDRLLADDMARVAYQWYGKTRQALTLTWRQARTLGMRVGDLIVEIGAAETQQDIRTAITGLTVQFAQSLWETHGTTLQTQFAELDVLRLF